MMEMLNLIRFNLDFRSFENLNIQDSMMRHVSKIRIFSLQNATLGINRVVHDYFCIKKLDLCVIPHNCRFY